MRSPTTIAAGLFVLDKKRQQDGGIIASFHSLLHDQERKWGRRRHYNAAYKPILSPSSS
jgi:hypothetical protein